MPSGCRGHCIRSLCRREACKGWNWIGCPAEGDALPLVDAFANLAPDEGDMIVGREGFATADGEGRWIGDLSQLLLGRGYMYLSGSPKEFVYNIAPAAEESHKSVARFSKYSAWTPASRKYPSVMPVISRIVRSGEEIPGGEYEVAAFCDDECRGVGVPVDGYMMISVFGLPGIKSASGFIPQMEAVITSFSRQRRSEKNL